MELKGVLHFALLKFELVSMLLKDNYLSLTPDNEFRYLNIYTQVFSYIICNDDTLIKVQND